MEGNEEFFRKVSIIFLGVLLIFIGVVGNSLVAIAVWKTKALRSTANYLLVNVALADMMSLVFLPLMLVGMYARFQEGVAADLLCKFLISTHIPITASFAAIFTLLVLSVEKYHAIVKPMTTRFRLREDTVRYAIIGVWISAIVMALPMFIFGKYKRFGKKMLCDYDGTEDDLVLYSFHLVAIVIVIPFIIISFCYFEIVRELYFKTNMAAQNPTTAADDTLAKRKVIKLSLSITLALLICFFPMAVSLCLKAYDKEKYERKYIKDFCSLFYVLEMVLNPFLYAFQSTNFRQAFKKILKLRVCWCKK